MKRIGLAAIMVALPLHADLGRRYDAEIIIDGGAALERACYFEGQRYSEGAVLKDEGGTIRCSVLDGVTENGPLGWLREGETGQPVIEQRQDENGRVIEIKK